MESVFILCLLIFSSVFILEDLYIFVRLFVFVSFHYVLFGLFVLDGFSVVLKIINGLKDKSSKFI